MRANIFNPDFQDFIRALNSANVDYVLVGGYAVILHGYHRTTGDLDIWVRRTKENYQKILAAFRFFGMPVFDMSEANFLNNADMDVFSFGLPPVSIDLMTATKGLNFDDAFAHSQWFEFEELMVRSVNLSDLILAKKASGRFKDKADIKQLKIKNPPV